MELNHAQAILNEARNYGVYEGDVPESEEEAIKEAKLLIKQAQEAWDAGAKGEPVQAVLNMAESYVSDSLAPGEVRDNGDGTFDVNQIGQKADKQELPVLPVELDSEATLEDRYESKQLGIAKAAAEKLPLPPEVDDPPSLPFDFSRLTPQEVRAYHSQFHACACRTNWLLSVEKNYHAAAKRIADMYVRRYLQENKPTKTVTITERKAEAEGDENVKKWRDKEFDHETEINTLKVLAEDYARTSDRLSRDSSMRAEEMKHD